MNAFLKGLAAVLVFMVMYASPVRAGGASDLWWNSSESGWGVNVVEQGGILFLTFFVYGQNEQPLWLVGPSTQVQSEGAGGRIYNGPLYQTSGPWLGGPFNPSAVVVSQVGTVTFTHITTTTANLAYTINGTSVNKSLTRQTWKTNTFLTGQYLGGIAVTRTGCASGAARYESLMPFTVSLSGSTMRISMQPSGGAACSASGTYVQSGSVGGFDGSIVSCANGASGSVSFSAIDANAVGITGRFLATYAGGCTEDGDFSGVFRAD
ncbi:MAG: hypothetical protein IPP91_05450 [Betaproteobacteria bacterium]|nr:hypothetical protein [Betaproteobacteria bacterium]